MNLSNESLERAASALKYRIGKVGGDPNTYRKDGLGEVLQQGMQNDQNALKEIETFLLATGRAEL